MGETRPQSAGETHKPDSLLLSSLVSLIQTFKYTILSTQCNELCKIVRDSTAISQHVTLKMTDVPAKHVWYTEESYFVYAAIYIAIETLWIHIDKATHI